MQTENPPIALGYSPIPPGCLANVVTCLEMLDRPDAAPVGFPDGFTLQRWERPETEAYRALFRLVGERWMWTSRLLMPDAELRAILDDPGVEVSRLMRGGRAVGILELDFRAPGQCELGFFGLAEEAIGQGIGRALMSAAIERAWAAPIRRFWVHTCSFDHPAAARFYQRSGFRPYAIMVEVHPDLRLTGKMPRMAAPHVPLIEAASGE